MRAAKLLYRGEITHQGTAYPGQHEAILDPELCQIVQDKLAANRRERALAVGAEAPSLLAGLIVDAEGNPMTPTHAKKRAKRYRYYVSASLLDRDRRTPSAILVFRNPWGRGRNCGSFRRKLARSIRKNENPRAHE